MTTLTYAQVAALVKQEGFPANDQVTMVAICSAESGRVVEAKNAHSSASGLFQILWSVHQQYDQRKLLSDAAYNTKAAHDIYKSQGLHAWVAYSSGAYQKYVNSARQGVAQAASVTGAPVLPGAAAGAAQQGVTYGPAGPQIINAGVGIALAADEATNSPLSGLRVMGSEIEGDFATTVIGTPMFSSGVTTVPHLVFTIVDPEGDLLWRMHNLWVKGTRVQYQDLDLRLDELIFEPGSHGTGQLTITAVDDIAYALMGLQGPRTAENISATQWIAQELGLAGLDPNQWFLGESVPTQSVIARDDADQSSTSGSGAQPSAWTTATRLAQELGKRIFISGKRLVFGSAAFAMQWAAEGPLTLAWHAATDSERWMNLPTAKSTSVGNRSNVLEVTGKVPLNRAKFFRPGVPVLVHNTPSVAGDEPVRFMVSSMSHSIGTDTDGADISLLEPVDPPPQPPPQPTAAGVNGGSTSAGGSVSGGGADGQISSFVAIALQQAGKRYVFGAEASPSDPNPRAFDCSELVQWAAARAGISPAVPDGSAAQQSYCRSKGRAINVQQGINTKGALLFMPGHVAISLGNGKTIEAMNPSNGVRQGNANNRGWTSAGIIPGAQGYNIAAVAGGSNRVV